MGRTRDRVMIQLNNIRPLSILKQIMTMFCDINPGLAKSDQSLRHFIMNPEEKNFNANKYRIFKRTVELLAQSTINTYETVQVSEIVASPIGLLLYLDLPQDSGRSEETEITSFASYDWTEEKSVSLELYCHEIYGLFPRDYRTRQEIDEAAEVDRSIRTLIPKK